MSHMFCRHLPLIIATFVLIALCASSYRGIVTANDANFIYPVDDTYIHMAIAKNIVQHRVWGVTSHEFSSSSSSILWPILLSGAYLVPGVHDTAPLVLNLLAGIGLLCVLHAFFLAVRLPLVLDSVLLLLLIVVAPLPNVIFVGMEHTLQCLCFTALVCYGTLLLCRQERSGKERLALSGLCCLAVSVRYEGLLITVVVCLLFLLKRDRLSAVFAIAGAALPVVSYGFISVAYGSWFWPNSVLIKGREVQGGIPLLSLFRKLFVYVWGARLQRLEHVYVPIALSIAGTAAIVLRERSLDNVAVLITTIAAVVTLGHLTFSNIGFFRYDVYLATIAIAALGAVIGHLWEEAACISPPWHVTTAACGFLIVALAPAIWYGRTQAGLLVPASQDIYAQQYHTGLFAARYYAGEPLAINDIGAVCYLADPRLFDIYGLGSRSVAAAKLARSYTAARFSELADQSRARIAMIYRGDDWLPEDQIPRQWEYIGRWTYKHTVLSAGDTVWIYACHARERGELVANLLAFKKDMASGTRLELAAEGTPDP